MDREQRAVLNGEMSEEEYVENNRARAVGGINGILIVAMPGGIIRVVPIFLRTTLAVFRMAANGGRHSGALRQFVM